MAKIGSVWANESWNDADWAAGTWADAHAPAFPSILQDLTTVFVPYLEGLIAADASADACTDLRDDLPMIRAAVDRNDLNTDYAVELS